MKLKPLDAPTAATAMRMSLKQVRALKDYDPETDIVQVPAFIADQVEFEKARLDFIQAVKEGIRPMVERISAAMTRISRLSRPR